MYYTVRTSTNYDENCTVVLGLALKWFPSFGVSAYGKVEIVFIYNVTVFAYENVKI